MKRIFLFAFVLCLLFSFTSVYASNASANPTPVNQAIETFKNSDGAASEDAVAELENLFFIDPVAFVTDLSKHDAETQILIAQQLSAFIAGGYISEIEQFNTALSTLKASELDKVRATLVGQIESFFVEYYDSQAVVVESTKPAPVFDVEIIKGFIGTNKEAGFPFDEEFNAKLAECYRLDPRLFVKTLKNLNSDEIQIIAANIAIANESSKDLNVEKQPAGSSGTVLTEEEEQILADLESQIRSIHTQSPSVKGENVMAAVPTPTIGTMSYSGTIEVNTPTTLSVVLSETTQRTVARSYYVEIICIRDNVEYIKSTGTVTIPVNATSVTGQFTFTQYSAGTFYTKVKVYTAKNGTLLTSRTGAYPDVSWGYWSISVTLDTDRTVYGTLSLYDAGGALKKSCSCLGNSVSGAAMNVTNGITPTGPYYGNVVGPASDTAAQGPYRRVDLPGAPGNLYVPPRSEIMIHGGRSQTTLQPTYGCVRVFDLDVKGITDTIITMTSSGNGHYSQGNVNIWES